MPTTRGDIEAVLWRGADTFRGTIDAANYKDYVLSMLFIKYLTDTHRENVDNLIAKYDGKDDIRLERAKARLPFCLRDEYTFDTLYNKRNEDNLGEIINIALRGIEDDNPQQLAGVFRSIDFNSEAMLGNRQQRNSRLRELLEDFRGLDLRPSQIDVTDDKGPADIIGDAYEYMIGQFASQAGKKAGSFFTPMMVSELMAQLVAPKAGERIYDPTCGSGSLLIRAARKAGIHNVAIYGQEMNGSSWTMARMNMFIHGIHDANIKWGDTLANPLHLDEDGNLMLFDVIVANMPFSQDKWAAGFNPGGNAAGNGKKKFKMEASMDPYHRFSWGVPPASKGDWAFLLHMIHSLNNGGRIAAVAPHGVLFRGAAEGRIRRKVIDNNLLDAVIGLPANLFYGTSIPACILIFKKGREREDILFIDASTDGRYEKGKNQNRLLPKHIDDIIQAYQKREDVDKFAHVASLKEIKENDYNLNIPRYVDTFEEEEPVDLAKVKSEIEEIEKELAETQKKMREYLKELGI